MLPIEKFADTEVKPLLREVDGPIDSFKVEEEFKEAVLSQAVEKGNLEGVSFQACPPLGNLEQKKVRQESLRAWRIWQNLNPSNRPYTPEEIALIGYASNVIWQATLVEASRRTFLAQKGQSSDDPVFCEAMVKRSIEELYPHPELEIAAESLSLFIPKVEVLAQSTDGRLQFLAEELLNKYPFIKEIPQRAPEVLDPRKEAALKEILKSKYQAAFNQLKEEFTEINNQILPQVCTRFLELAGLADTGWVIEESKDRNGFYTRSKDRVIECGKRSKEITWPAFEKIFGVHEVGVHATRAERGYQAGSEPLALGLGNHQDAEEGVAILFEKTWGGTTSKPMIDRGDYRYLTGAYASGVIDGRPHDKDETFQFITRLNQLSLLAAKCQKGEAADIEEVTRSTRLSMFEHVYRAFRGMPEGIVLTKDLLYKKGKVKLIRYINESNLSMEELYDFLTSGKFDPTNKEHLKLREAILHGKATA